MNQSFQTSPSQPANDNGFPIVIHPRPIAKGPYNVPYQGDSGNVGWGMFLLVLGVAGGGFGLAIGSGVLAVKGAVVSILGFVRICRG